MVQIHFLLPLLRFSFICVEYLFPFAHFQSVCVLKTEVSLTGVSFLIQLTTLWSIASCR